ncbi:TonB-dependent receptor, partial [bacterium]|nr:TonB-dependent receptor [bacterium]
MIPKLKWFVPALVAAVCSQSVAIVPPTDKINLKGYVKDSETGETLPYANVVLKGTDYGTASNTNGYFVLVNVPIGLCTLRVTYIGYKPTTLPVEATESTPPITVEIEPQNILLEGVTVTAENQQTLDIADKTSEIRLSPRQLKKLPSVGEVDIFRSLQLLPGISAANDGSSGLYVRGGTPDQNLVLFDGMTIYQVDHFFGFISAFN